MPLYLGSKTVSENINMGDTVIQNTFDLFDVKWSDHVINNESWMCADDFNWIDGTVFSAAWNELKSEWDLATIDSTPPETETIGTVTISYWRSPKGYKLVNYGGNTPEEREQWLEQVYTETGIAWYYLIDTTGQIRFKLPRTKYGFVGVRSGAGNFVDESLPNITGSFQAHTGDVGVILASTSSLSPTGTFSGVQDKKAAGLSSQSGTQDRAGTLTFNASLSSSVYKDGANVQQKSTEMHLYFYLADFVRTPLESNLNTFITETKEALNEKVNISDYNADKTLIENDINTLETTKITQIDLDDTINTQRTNCITKIPQDIKLELADGTLTLKAGSKVYVPNGVGVFDEVVIQSDLKTSFDNDNQKMVFLNASKNGIVHCNVINQQSSGASSSSSSSYNFWYDTVNNYIKFTNNSGESWTSGYSLPICLVTRTKTLIDQVFNGFGYIGNTIFALPGIEGLIPNGRNIDGSLNNTKFTTTKVLSRTYGNNETYTDADLMLSSSQFTTNYVKYYNDKNLNVDSIGRTNLYVNCGIASFVNGRITAFSPKPCFHAVDYYDFKQFDNNTAKLDENNVFTQPITVDINPINFIAKNSKIEKGVTPSSNLYCGYDVRGKDDARLLWFGVAYGISGIKRVELQKQDTNLTELNFEQWLTKIATPAAGANGTEAVNASWTNTKLNTKANLASPAFSGIPTAPTQASTDNSTRIATTAWVNNFFNSSGKITGKCMPNYAAGITFSSGSAAPADGLLVMSFYHNDGGSNTMSIQIGSVEVGGFQQHDYDNQSAFFPVLKGQIVTWSGADVRFSKFYPYIGA